MTAPPAEIDWMALSMPSREAILHIAVRKAAGLTLDEITEVLDRERPELRHLVLPEKVTKGWVQARMRDVRREISERGAAH